MLLATAFCVHSHPVYLLDLVGTLFVFYTKSHVLLQAVGGLSGPARQFHATTATSAAQKVRKKHEIFRLFSY